ncbi:MAG: hypothetical protein KDB61_13025 [Planctomycetes bacterium]|nr:hypothetical protein [Planctomycetota bacterium]
MKALPLWTLALPVLAFSCATAPPMGSAPVQATPGWETSMGGNNPVLYGRDGTPVGTMGQGTQGMNGPVNPTPTVTSTEDMPHRPVDAGGSRPVLLELFQEAIAERDNLKVELDVAREALMETEDRLLEMEAQLTAELQAGQAAKVAQEKAEAQMFEMGKRLAVAQMRRLEAEKLLLEKTLAERRNVTTGATE